MKKFLIICILIISVVTTCACSFNAEDTDDCIRIHIRANSNTDIDQSVKLTVRDAVVNYLTPYLSECADKAAAKDVIISRQSALRDVADKVLSDNGFAYTATVGLRREKFPYREYDGHRFPEGIYDALIIELGAANGNNWWCVCFPPLCFVPDDGSENFKYKSKILEIIKKTRG